MQKINNQLVIRIDDYQLLTSYLNSAQGKMASDRKNAEDLQLELKKAKLVDKKDFPDNVVRLDSRVKVKADDMKDVFEFRLVTPDKADFKNKKISIMSPIGTALIGFQQGQKVKWHVPGGNKEFTILEVVNE